MGKKKCVAMLLAGGKGSRLSSLTKSLAKPAVPFGGKYRIIDFTLSNCTNSGIDTVGVLTQYQPLVLNSYIGIGSAWDLDRKNGGVTVLPPYSESSEVKWYTGTASAIYQNLNYLKQYDPEYVLILSGDHIYKMNYELMLNYHIEKGADATISVIEVPWPEASRFGIMNTDEEMRVAEFEEKPAYPKNNLASMGIYIFNWSVLKEYLEMDDRNPESTHDFGKDIIPLMLDENKKLFAYPFNGYWKDVGTVKSLWEANMDLLDDECELNLFDHDWRIYSVNPNHPPQYISTQAEVAESLINEGCTIEGEVEKSVLFQGVLVGKNTVIRESVIMPDAVIGENVYIEKAIVPSGLNIPDGVVISASEEDDEIILITPEMIQGICS
ncbi:MULTISPECIES: glucose-1-phosphate adenylyltransferase [Cytobacillus]|jgi:glucose-1-phosphate adenylyltransferase|uniref:Glucose-1-phosphate adenylyltransferase n=1 Tax=Cytobacillus oceanisediminis 2691 TaxID=1196031 RepID=A0A160MFA9_9BACI|nr:MULTISPECIES: glucose-1-phosphate adenylyltransferase [Cytobacillus]MBY0158870.1 glucose-1-phosphate adenylyltransferase [Cytobacillus firmus]AND41897.1 glucose-1-phosphate adenylyltransferase [Cytobacillus oceanisediminis 2691]MBU8733477.1 glucose-1-phosphate adenylyltransferase [Cytobacillus oceanisediminis]MCM3246654.1 glucose-1-phosphate adenylyltransferase [Cytobacillus oceanisediminis]MCM3392851.1 glucose-1-phosphate adenylyltransferase [Cytobacillus oceanisediminis]